MSDTAFLEDVEIVYVTHKAVLVLYEGTQDWIPLQFVDADGDLEKGNVVDMHVARWIAKEKGFV